MDSAAELNCKLGQFLVHFRGYSVGLFLFSDRVHSIDVILARLLDKTCKFPMHYLHGCSIKKIYNKSEAINILTTIKLHRVNTLQADHVKQTHVTHINM